MQGVPAVVSALTGQDCYSARQADWPDGRIAGLRAASAKEN